MDLLYSSLNQKSTQIIMKTQKYLAIIIAFTSMSFINMGFAQLGTNTIKTQNEKKEAEKHQVSSQFKVWGNCGLCKQNIEKALKVAGILKSDWNKDTKIIDVKYDTTIISLVKIHQVIASAGYDTEIAKGNEEAYNKLEKCCQYTRRKED